MPGAIVGALAGWAFSGSIIAAGLATSILGAVLIGASIGSLFDAPDLDIGNTTPNYSFGPISNTKSQLLPIPLVYGRCRVGGNIFLQQFDTNERKTMDMMIGLSAGPINKVVSVYADEHLLYKENLDTYTYWIWTYTGAYTTDDEGRVHHTIGWVQISQAEYSATRAIRKEVRDINGNVFTAKILEGCSCDFYKGTATQNADSREPDGNTYPNLAYVALTLKAQEGLSGNPVITTILEGRKVWTPSGVRYTRNPAWIIYDVLTDAENGIGIPTAHIDLDSFETAAAYCDELVDGEPRYTLDYIIDTQRPAVDHLTAMLACFGGYFIPRDKIELHIERSGTVYKELNPDNFVKGSFSWWQKSNDDSPNRITIEWIDPDNHYEQTAAVFEWQEDIIARGLYEKSVSLLGITRSTQVGRMGKYMLETAKLVQNFCSFAVSTQDADIEAGEVVSLTYPNFTAWSAKPFRVLSVQDDGQTGNVLITCAEYVASLYDDSQIPVAVPVNPNPAITTDDVYNLILEDIGAFNADGTWVPIIKASWQNPADYTPQEIYARYRYNGDADWILALSTKSIEVSTVFTMLRAGEELEVWVNCKRPNGTHTPGDVASIIVGADIIPPSAPTSLTAEGWFGNINLEWANPTDPDLSYIEVWENDIDDRDTAVKIAEVKGTSYQRYLGSFVVRYYWVRAVDRTGNISGYNALVGTPGNSDQENHQDFVDLVLQENPYLAEVQTDLNTGIEKISLDEELVAQGLIDAMLNAREGKQESDVAVALAKREISTKVVEGLSAEASERLLLAAIVGGNIAAIQSEATARANADSAIASNVTTLQTTVGNNTSAIQIIDSSVDGIQSKHAVKIDTNGYVTGYELIGTGVSSAMVFHVDNFLVGKVGSTNQYPFVIGTVDGVSRVSIDSAFIQDGAIKNAKILNGTIENAKIKDAAINNAKIADATIERLKIVGHTLTEVASYYASAGVTILGGYGAWQNLASITITTEAGYSTPIVFTAALQGV